MANNTPHIVGGGLGTFRKEGRAKYEAKQEAARKAANKDAIARMAKAAGK